MPGEIPRNGFWHKSVTGGPQEGAGQFDFCERPALINLQNRAQTVDDSGLRHLPQHRMIAFQKRL